MSCYDLYVNINSSIICIIFVIAADHKKYERVRKKIGFKTWSLDVNDNMMTVVVDNGRLLEDLVAGMYTISYICYIMSYHLHEHRNIGK
jgi:hypothetical protein